MRLISLTSNKEGFHPVTFNRVGPSLILGAQKDATKKHRDRTYNGVGKSLLIALLHFCLGSNRNKEFESKIPDWEFILTFEHSGQTYRVNRSTSSQHIVRLNGDELSVADYKTVLGQLAFPLAESISRLSFRSLINSFIRPRKENYVSFDQSESPGTDYGQLLRIGFLLGLDMDLIVKKQEYRTEKERIKKLRDSLSKDTVFVEFFTGNKNPDIELHDLDRRIARLTKDVAEFKIADDYHERQREADSAAKTVQELRNRLVVLSNAVQNISKSLTITPDLKPDMLFSAYAEAKAALPSAVVKSVEEVAAFHEKLLRNRIKRLTAEKLSLQRDVDAVNQEIDQGNKLVDDLRLFLGTHGALDEFVQITNDLSKLQAKAQKLRDYKALLQTYSNKTQTLTAELSRETIKANTYLKDAEALLASNFERFCSFSSRFYGERPGGLTVTNNEGDNQIRFDVSARIEDDAADGINEVKIFCFDMTLLTQQHNHAVEFLVHDSRLFSDVDMRQRATIFKLAQDITVNEDFQYIATINEDQVEAMRDQFTAAEFKNCVENAVVLKLTDESPAAKLLGIEVDMHY